MSKTNSAVKFYLPVGAFILLFVSSCFLKPLPFDEKQWLTTVDRTETKDLYSTNQRDDIFFNPWLPQQERSFFRFLRWRMSQSDEYSEQAQNHAPKIIPDLIPRIKKLPESVDFITWVGHATFLIRLAGDYWLTDPIFSDRALLPKRITPPAIIAEDLRELNGRINVVISHNHYDHLDKDSLRRLPPGSRYYVPMGLKDYVASFTSGPVEEMNWWAESHPARNVILTCLPAQHWSRRLFQGYNTTLWASYMIQANSKTIYFGGDSGFFKGYLEIGKRFPSINYALLPITAYEPRWFMHYPHMDTREAIRAFEDLGADYFIPTQWGTFHLGDNPPGLPALDLQRDISTMQRDKSRYLMLDIGEIRLL